MKITVCDRYSLEATQRPCTKLFTTVGNKFYHYYRVFLHLSKLLFQIAKSHILTLDCEGLQEPSHAVRYPALHSQTIAVAPQCS